MSRLVSCFLFSLCLLLGGCSRGADRAGRSADPHGDNVSGENHEPQGARDPHAEEGDARAGEIRVPLEGLTGIAFAEVGEPVEEGAWSAAEAVADESARSLVASPVAGVVTEIRAVPGHEVGAGAALVEIRSTELATLRSELLAAKAELERSAAGLAREERLAAAGAGAQRELEAAKAEQAVAAARADAARLALEARGIDAEGQGTTFVVRARRAGRIAAWGVLEGAGIEAGQQLGSFDAGGAALVRVELALPGAPGWTPGVEARVRRADGVEWRAAVEGVPRSLEVATRRLAYRLRIVVERSSQPLPVAGTPLEVRVPLPPGVVLPQTAFQQIEGAWGLFVVEGDVAEFRAVRRGPELGGDVLVLEGVATGERVATAGAYLLKALHLKRAGGGDAHAH